LLWCFRQSTSDRWASKRAEVELVVNQIGGRLHCFETPAELEEFLIQANPLGAAAASADASRVVGQPWYIILFEWSELRPLLQTHADGKPQSVVETVFQSRPRYILLRCQRSSGGKDSRPPRKSSQIWLRQHPFPEGVKHYLCSDFDLGDVNIIGMIHKVARSAERHFSGLPGVPLAVGLHKVDAVRASDKEADDGHPSASSTEIDSSLSEHSRRLSQHLRQSTTISSYQSSSQPAMRHHAQTPGVAGFDTDSSSSNRFRATLVSDREFAADGLSSQSYLQREMQPSPRPPGEAGTAEFSISWGDDYFDSCIVDG